MNVRALCLFSLPFLPLALSAPCAAEAPDAVRSVGAEAAYRDGAHYSDYKLAQCSNATTCVVRFDKPPAKKTLLVTRVTCGFVSSSNGPVVSVQLARAKKGNFAQPINLPLSADRTSQGFVYSASNEEVSYPVPDGFQPVVQAFGTTVAPIQANCQIVGTLVD